jgi:hypothetical protein
MPAMNAFDLGIAEKYLVIHCRHQQLSSSCGLQQLNQLAILIWFRDKVHSCHFGLRELHQHMLCSLLTRFNLELETECPYLNLLGRACRDLSLLTHHLGS